MLKEKYEFYKRTYDKYLIIIKSGNFYICINEDALILHKLFNYKIIELNNFIKVGFPLSNIDKIVNDIELKQINYIIVDEEIIQKQKYKNNQYNKNLLAYDNYQICINRINKISEILKNNIINSNIKNTLNQIEELVCKISY